MEMAVFVVAAIIALASAVMVITVRQPIGSILFLILSIAAQSVLYIMLSGLFLAAFLILVYAGAILVLFLFVVMMLNIRHADPGADQLGKLKPIAWVFGAALLAELVWVLKGAAQSQAGTVGQEFGSVPAVSRLLYGSYVYPFELTSILLLVAIVGAIIMAKKEL